MKVFRDLVITGPGEKLSEFLSNVEALLDDGWVRLHERERELLPTKFFCFSCSAKGNRPAASLFLTYRGSTELYVSNVVPKEIGQLVYDQYNNILLEFCERFVRKAAKQPLIVTLTGDEKTITDCLPSEGVRLLTAFSRGANKSTGSGHPKDRERWFKFLVYVRGTEGPSIHYLLERWFLEEENWPEEKVRDLMEQYEFAMDLLHFYDTERISEHLEVSART
jgi:hypothetical protein